MWGRSAGEKWLGYEDSNLGMTESESVGLPLADTPVFLKVAASGVSFLASQTRRTLFGWGTRI